jgi:hypothetical protein
MIVPIGFRCKLGGMRKPAVIDMHNVHNDRIKLLAAAANNIGVGAILAGRVATMIRGDINALTSLAIRLPIGLDFLRLAYILRGRLRTS